MFVCLIATISLLGYVAATAVSPPVDLESHDDLVRREFSEPFILNIASTYCDNIIVNADTEYFGTQGSSGLDAMTPAMYAGDGGAPRRLTPSDNQNEEEYCKIAEVAFTKVPDSPRMVDIGIGTKKVDGNGKNLYCSVDFDDNPGSEPLTWFIGLPLDFKEQPTFNITCYKDCDLLGDSNMSEGITCMESYFDLVEMNA